MSDQGTTQKSINATSTFKALSYADRIKQAQISSGNTVGSSSEHDLIKEKTDARPQMGRLTNLGAKKKETVKSKVNDVSSTSTSPPQDPVREGSGSAWQEVTWRRKPEAKNDRHKGDTLDSRQSEPKPRNEPSNQKASSSQNSAVGSSLSSPKLASSTAQKASGKIEVPSVDPPTVGVTNKQDTSTPSTTTRAPPVNIWQVRKDKMASSSTPSPRATTSQSVFSALTSTPLATQASKAGSSSKSIPGESEAKEAKKPLTTSVSTDLEKSGSSTTKPSKASNSKRGQQQQERQVTIPNLTDSSAWPEVTLAASAHSKTTPADKKDPSPSVAGDVEGSATHMNGAIGSKSCSGQKKSCDVVRRSR